jgi:hypothetical protein
VRVLVLVVASTKRRRAGEGRMLLVVAKWKHPGASLQNLLDV